MKRLFILAILLVIISDVVTFKNEMTSFNNRLDAQYDYIINK